MSTMFDYEFMRNAFYACTVVGIVAGAVGYFLVLRGQTFAGHALTHVGFSGATGAGLIGLSPFLGLTVFTVIAGIGIGLLGERAHRDVAIGIVLTLSLGLGLLFLHFYTAFAGQATNVLFGNVLGISLRTVIILAVLAVAILVVLVVIARPLLFASLQPELAEARGVPVTLVSTLFMVLVAFATAEAAQIVGVLLVFALMVAPAATAFRLTRGVFAGILVSMALAVAIAWISLAFAYRTDWPTSFWITALGAAAYLASGYAERLTASRRMGRPTAGEPRMTETLEDSGQLR
ncbi:metal ABC transporter permease [Mesorhizobium sp. PAMC28654]|uniref:metal ABC transporter permease n=1 Tax=Mesorhizobium sp. PAMC28654 TaxID=2880934 RepID=UPI001D0AE838|nr:metal ABC transporter permease [Mesorhizobium sp. PAMC28654]UDL89362.1 metal ABC transporter permease [Mesorhizobium sp. PAMC28654]